MLTLYYSPQTRASRVISLLMKMGRLDDVDIRTVHVRRHDGSGGKDANNPHVEGKVPLLVHDGEVVRESPAVFLYLTDLFGGPLGRAVGEKGRGEYISWLAYYGDIIEPVMALQGMSMGNPKFARIFDEIGITATFRGPEEVKETLVATLREKPFLMGDEFSAADLLMASPYQWFPAATPDDPLVHAWVARCAEQIDQQALMDFEAKALKELGLN